jgi:precorrin isomerase
MNEFPVKLGSSQRALIHELYGHPMSGEVIEARSFEIIDHEARAEGFSREQWEVVRRILHTTADFGLMDNIRFLFI